MVLSVMTVLGLVFLMTDGAFFDAGALDSGAASAGNSLPDRVPSGKAKVGAGACLGGRFEERVVI